MAFPSLRRPSFPGLSMPRRPPPLFYGWYIVGASTINAALLLGMVFYGFGVFITPLTNDLGWATAAVAFGFTLQRMQAGLMGPLAGYAIDRLGSRPVALIGVTLTGLGFFVFAGVQELWQFYAASILIAIGQTMGTIAPFSAALMHWFYRYRARATAFMMAGTGLGAVSIYPLVAVVEAVGWRTTLVLVAALVWVVGALTALVLRRPPQRYGLLPDGVAVVDTPYPGSPSPPPAPAESSEGYGLGVGQALRTRAFWLLLTTTILFGFGNLGWVVLQFPALEAKGFSAGLASAAVAVYGFASIGSRVILGVFGDRLGRQRLYLVSFLLQAAGLVIFALADVFWQLIPYYFLYGVGHAAYVITSQTIVADFFGTYRFATIRGWMGTLSSLGGASGPVVGALIFDSSGSYTLAFLFYAAAALVAFPVVFFAARARPRLRARAPDAVGVD